MKVILNEDVKSLGKKGDVVEVSDGYGRNFLISKGKAKEATASNLSILNDIKSKEIFLSRLEKAVRYLALSQQRNLLKN